MSLSDPAKLLVTCPMYWSKEVAGKKAWLYLASAEKAGVKASQLRPYGFGAKQYPGTATMRIYDQVTFLESFAGTGKFTHVLFTDAWDVMFVRPLADIIDKYNHMGCPPFLIGSVPREFGFFDVHEPELYVDLFSKDLAYPYPSTSFHIGEIRCVAEQLSKVPKDAHNESYNMLAAYRDPTFNPVMDHQCELFQDNGHHRQHGLLCEIRDGRVYNPTTGTHPCIVHWGGGHTDPETGKDVFMIPWAKELGII